MPSITSTTLGKRAAAATMLVAATGFMGIASAVPTSGLSVQFEKANWDNYKIGAAPDVAKDFAAPSDGCTGFMREGQPCNPDVENHAQVTTVAGSSTAVLAINFKSGEFASESGGQFYKDIPSSLNTDVALLEYSVYFPKGFEWTLGGKLPGLYGGDHECSGSKVHPDGSNCFSARLMWRENGIGEVYMYMPFQQNTDAFCQKCTYPAASTCKGLSGEDYCAWERGSFKFSEGSWTKVQEYVKLNTPGEDDGVFELYIDGNLVASHENVVYRTTPGLKIGGMLFSTFFGGDSREYAPSSPQSIMFSGIKLST